MIRAHLVSALLRVAALLPLRIVHATGGMLGRAAARIPNPARHIVRVNIELCFPTLDQMAKRRLASDALTASACNLLELGAIWYWPLARVQALIIEVSGEDVLDRALAEDRGLLIIAPHLGAWELLQMWVAQRTTLHALYRPPRQAWLEALLNQARHRSGARFWPARPSGIRALFKALRAGEAVGLLPDQQPPGEGVFVDFCGHPAKTMSLPGKLAARSGAPVVVGWAERLAGGRGFRLHWRRADPAVADGNPARAARALNRSIEAVIRECPEQYLWTYRRFSRQPKGTGNPYKRYEPRGNWIVERAIRR